MYKPVVLAVLDNGCIETTVLRGDVEIIEIDFDSIDGSGYDAQEELDRIDSLNLGLPTGLARIKTKLSDIVRNDTEYQADLEDDEEDEEDDDELDIFDEDDDEFDDDDDEDADDEDEDLDDEGTLAEQASDQSDTHPF